ncbi:hypothetical protein NX801_16290 [Streptomyces sp. LP05-1]|uniref:XRE family transcriptional regulator n=1 Tax=Streptomyces pyxinae TaxID=2970734 RepID=A0ABT2CIF3_9ACTN|nr:hypothetical protein [Streptomyces sp. LP05-1]MCS0637193.1 hypothetical protein [Streptomyces sp. LP05-1]
MAGTTPRRGPGAAGDPLAEELARLLERGPFADALRTAIAAGGLSLDRVRDRLARRGAPLSVATLSSWQSGRRRPERPESLRALRQLEAVLGLPDNALRALLAPARPRGRRTLADRMPATADVWATRPGAAALLAPFAPYSDAALRRLSVHDRMIVGPDGRARELHATLVLRAEEDGPDRLVLLTDWGDGPRRGAPVPVTNPRNCRVGRVVRHPDSGLTAVELLFERALRRDETVLIAYESVRPDAPDRTSARGDRVSRYFRGVVRAYVLEVCFDPAALPARCRQLTTRIGEAEPKAVRNLEAGPSGTVHAIGLDFGPGKFGISWHMAE